MRTHDGDEAYMIQEENLNIYIFLRKKKILLIPRLRKQQNNLHMNMHATFRVFSEEQTFNSHWLRVWLVPF